jgi:hypothetical protein
VVEVPPLAKTIDRRLVVGEARDEEHTAPDHELQDVTLLTL